MSTEEERVRSLPRKPSRRPRKPEQDVDRGAEIVERTLLPKRRPHLVRGNISKVNQTAHATNGLF